MNYEKIIFDDVANGKGMRTSLFVTGCRNCCDGCFNKQLWDFYAGKKFTKNEEDLIIANMDKYHSGISLLGGDPFELENVKDLLPFVRRFKEECPDKSIWCWTGYLFNNLKGSNKLVDELLTYIDILIDGPFISSERDVSLKWRGSKNQRLIQCKKSIKENKIILLE